jgi:acetolactate synthase-1/2/3 large subunit
MGGSLAQSGAMNVSEVMVRYLKAAGVDHVFGYPGDPNIEFMEAARRAGMQFVLGRREGTAGLMAEAYGFLTARPGVCRSTLGPGSSNLVNAVANAYLVRALRALHPPRELSFLSSRFRLRRRL